MELLKFSLTTVPRWQLSRNLSNGEAKAVCTAIMLPCLNDIAVLVRLQLNTRCEVHRLAFHACLFPRLPDLQIGAAFFSPAFPVPRSGAASTMETDCPTLGLRTA